MAIDRVTILRALADETRLGMVRAVAQRRGAVSGCDVIQTCEQLSQLSQPTLSHHFAKLVDAGVLIEYKSGTHKSYELNKRLLTHSGINIKHLIKEEM